MNVLIWRTGAYGDQIVVTPLIRHLHNQGHKVFIVAGERGEQVLKNNPHVHKIIEHDKNVKNENLGDHMDYLMRKYHCDRLIDLNESIECAISLHPRSPEYKLPKKERLAKYNRNFYEYCFEHAKEPIPALNGYECDSMYMSKEFFKPELFFDEKELREARNYLKPGFNILVGLSGSGSNKAWPWIMDLCNNIGKTHPEIHIITVGDIKCEILEDIDTPDLTNITYLSGKIPMRISMALSSMVDLLISPDTGLLHASGAYKTPKIGLLGHTTKEMITKHFENDYSIEADERLAPCSPCSYMIYDPKMQCPLDPMFNSSICMSEGIPLQVVYERIMEVYSARLQEKS